MNTLSQKLTQLPDTGAVKSGVSTRPWPATAKWSSIVRSAIQSEGARRRSRVLALAVSGRLSVPFKLTLQAASAAFGAVVFKWQADTCDEATSINAGLTSRQTGMTCGHRGWNAQPLGTFRGLGISPAMGL